MSAASPDPYDQIAELAHAELAFVEAGDLDAVPDLHARRAALIAGLPERAPAAASAALERAATAQCRTTALLTAAHADVATELHHLSRGRRAARSYAPAAAPTAPMLDRPA